MLCQLYTSTVIKISSGLVSDDVDCNMDFFEKPTDYTQFKGAENHYSCGANTNSEYNDSIKVRSTSSSESSNDSDQVTDFGSPPKKEIAKNDEKDSNVDEKRRFHSYKNLLFYFFRLLTFKDWPLDFINPGDCAATGLFYLHNKDMVQCVYCRGVIGFWEEGDIPAEEHEKHFPLCPLVQGGLHTNVTNKHPVLEETMKKKIQQEDPPHHKSVAMSADRNATSTTPYHFPELHDVTKRRQTYVQHTENMPSIDKLVDAGFFYIGLSDMTQCYVCGGGVLNWQKDEDPKEVHAKLYPRCPLSNCLEGQQQEVRMSQQAVNEEVMLELPLAKRLVCMGYPKELVGEAFLDHFTEYGTLANTLPESMDIVSDYQEKLEELEG